MMAILDIRVRAGYLFLAVVLGHILLISGQVTTKSGVPVLEAVTFGVFAEVQRTVATATQGVRRGWNGYIGLRHEAFFYGQKGRTGKPVEHKYVAHFRVDSDCRHSIFPGE